MSCFCRQIKVFFYIHCRAKMVGCSTEMEFLAKVHCIREASKVKKTFAMLLFKNFIIKKLVFFVNSCVYMSFYDTVMKFNEY